MVKIDAEICDVVIHCEVAGAIGVVPIKVDAGVQVSFPVFSYLVVLFQDCCEVDGMELANVLDAKIVDDKSEYYGAPLVVPEDRGGGTLVITMLLEALFEHNVC